MATVDAFLLPSVASELERMRIQAEAWEPEVEIWLDQMGVQPGWRCVDLGCGPVGILGPLSRRVERTGRVFGVDVDPGQLEAARQYVRDNRLESVEIVESSAFNTSLQCETFDLTHARFMFSPLGHDEDLLREMLALTRPGGVIAIQEPDISSWNSYPSRAAFRRLVSAIQDAFAEAGGDLTPGGAPIICSSGPGWARCRSGRRRWPAVWAIHSATRCCRRRFRCASGSWKGIF
jgi:ubiquinone/menaquinone biosynthesis C-methylase UbiE